MTTGTDVPDGIDADRVTAWLGHRADVTGPLTFEVIAGGRSNLTYRVTDAADRRWVLRRPPLHSVLQSAHDVGREHRIIDALAGSGVPVPPTVGLEVDVEVNGAPFYVMDFVDGIVARDEETATSALAVEARTAASHALVDTLVDLHAVDIDAVGLGGLAKREDYLGRQLRRWHGQLDKGRTRELPLLDDVHRRLAANVPVQGPATIVHGDYRLDNVIVGEAGDVRAVLDWELCTLGDPLADVGLLCVYWAEPGDETIPLGSSPTLADGFLTRAQIADRYAERSGRDLSELGYYMAFGFWKLAVILEGVYARFSSGAYGEVNEDVAMFATAVDALAQRADAAAQEVGR